MTACTEPREAAGPFFYLNEPTTAALILKGKRDNLALVQAFARHRLSKPVDLEARRKAVRDIVHQMLVKNTPSVGRPLNLLADETADAILAALDTGEAEDPVTEADIPY